MTTRICCRMLQISRETYSVSLLNLLHFMLVLCLQWGYGYKSHFLLRITNGTTVCEYQPIMFEYRYCRNLCFVLVNCLLAFIYHYFTQATSNPASARWTRWRRTGASWRRTASTSSRMCSRRRWTRRRFTPPGGFVICSAVIYAR